MTTRRDVLTGLATLPIAASLPTLPARPMTTRENLKAFYDDLLRIQASLAETVRRIENMQL